MTHPDGRIGYLHIESMNQTSLDEFERDLYAVADGRDGLIIDVRNNGGGWTADRLLASIAVAPHAYTVPRGADSSDADRLPAGPSLHPAVRPSDQHALQREELLQRGDHRACLQDPRSRHPGRAADLRWGDLDRRDVPRRRHLDPHSVPRLVPARWHGHGEQRRHARPRRSPDSRGRVRGQGPHSSRRRSRIS